MVKPLKHRFLGHYLEWIQSRITFLFSALNEDDYKYRSVLEVGAGYGAIGRAFADKGAFVTSTDGQPDHVAEIRRRHGKVVQDAYELNLMERSGYPCSKFDLVLHLGVLYHLTNPSFAIQQITKVTGSVLVLETEVEDTRSDSEHKQQEIGYDQSMSGSAVRPSASRVERCLTECGFTFTRYDDARLNSGHHVYDWTEQPKGHSYIVGHRRLWIAKRSC